MTRNERKKILLLSDDCRFFSGVGCQSRELIFNTIHHYNWCQLAGGLNHIEAGKVVDMSVPVASETGIADAYLKLYPVNGYGNADAVFAVMDMEKPDALMLVTDPRYFEWLFQIENRIRIKVPITYWNIWDNLPFPLWNYPFYKSCDSLFAISKQTYNINLQVLRPENCVTVDGAYNEFGKINKNE